MENKTYKRFKLNWMMDMEMKLVRRQLRHKIFRIRNRINKIINKKNMIIKSQKDNHKIVNRGV